MSLGKQRVKAMLGHKFSLIAPDDLWLDGRVKETTVLNAVDAASQEMLAKLDSPIEIPAQETYAHGTPIILKSTPTKAMNPLVRWANPRDIRHGDVVVLRDDGALRSEGPGAQYVVQSVDTRTHSAGGWGDRFYTFSMGCHVHKEPCYLCKQAYLGDFADLKDREDALFSRADIDRAVQAGVRMTARQRDDALHMRMPPRGRVIEDPIVRLENWLDGRPVTQQSRIDARDLFPMPKLSRMMDTSEDEAFDGALAALRSVPTRKKSP